MQIVTSIAPWTVAIQILNIVLIVGIPTLLLCLLQWRLSRCESAVPGLILPVLHVVISFILILQVAAYTAVDDISVTTAVSGDSVIVQDDRSNLLSLASYPDETEQPDASSVGIIGGADGPTSIYASSSNIPQVIGLFLLFNIPTYIYLIIYVIQRKKLRRRKTVDKTRIQDL